MTTEPSFDDLRAAIEEAMRKARFVIRRRGSQPSDVVVSTREAAALVADLRVPLERLSPELVPADMERITGLLRQSDTLSPHFVDPEKNTLNPVYTLLGPSFCAAPPVSAVCGELVLAALLHSPDKVAYALTRFLTKGTIPTKTVHLIKGPLVAETIALDEWTQLIPYDTALQLERERRLSFLGPGDWIPASGKASGCGLLVTSDTDLGTNAAGEPLEDQGLAQFGVDLVCAVLTLTTRKSFEPFARTVIIPEVYLDSSLMSRSLGFGAMNVEMPIGRTNLTLSPGQVDTDELASLVRAFGSAPEGVRQGIWGSLVGLRTALSRLSDNDRCLDTCTALEVLMGKPKTGKRLAKRTARAYERAAGAAPRDTEETILEFYAHRNEVSHGRTARHVRLADTRPDLVDTVMSSLIECIKLAIREQRILNRR